MSPKKSLLKTSRLLHLYLGVFATPALIFFAITGFLQTFSFHETTRGSDYKPPKILVQLGQLHKKQTLVVPVRKPQPPAPGEKTAANGPAADTHTSEKSDVPPTGRHNGRHQSEGPAENPTENKDKPATEKPTSDKAIEPTPSPADPNTPPAKKKNLWPMKIFFAIISFSLLLSTFTGLYMSYKYVRNKRLITASLIAGIVIPILLTFI